MEIETFNLKEFYIKKVIPYLLMLITLVFYGFPFKFPHNTYNWIQKFDLPAYTYPVFIVFFIISFIVMIGSFFTKPKISKKVLDLIEGSIHHKRNLYRFSDMVSYSLEGKHELTIENKTVWKFCADFEKERLLLHLLMSHAEKREFENYLEKFIKKAS
ncbi:MAG: hypothetical protein LAT68_17320 [Cyclobacteriaceae bacterium]|nr:hypothetical protein [Cyclobacteriaceae bacterium]